MKHIEKLEKSLYTPVSEKRRCLNDAKGAFNSDRYYAQILSDRIYVDEIIYSESFVEGNQTQEALSQNSRGGMVTFGTDGDSMLSNDKIINFLKQNNDDFKLNGWTVTKGLHGKYTDRETGEVFDEKSLSVELEGISADVLFDVAECLCNEFKQQSVLVKSYENNDIWLITGKLD